MAAPAVGGRQINVQHLNSLLGQVREELLRLGKLEIQLHSTQEQLRAVRARTSSLEITLRRIQELPGGKRSNRRLEKAQRLASRALRDQPVRS